MVQLGICAFRQSSIKDAHSCLMDIQSSGRAKEFLAQVADSRKQLTLWQFHISFLLYNEFTNHEASDNKIFLNLTYILLHNCIQIMK